MYMKPGGKEVFTMLWRKYKMYRMKLKQEERRRILKVLERNNGDKE